MGTSSVITRLGFFYRRNGYVRRAAPERRAALGSRYKKGDELRLVASSKEELALIRALLLEAGFEPGRPFAKGNQYRVPVYGRDAVERFLRLIGEPTPSRRRRGTEKRELPR